MSDLSKLPIVKHDYETRSGYDLSLVGRQKYVKHKDAAIICLSYKPPEEATKLWIPGMPVPECFRDTTKYRYAAFNIQFDASITATLGRKHGFVPIPLANQIDAMAVAARFGLPQKLDRLGPALNVTLPKMSTGTALKKLFCQPPYCDPTKDAAWHKVKLHQFYEYCLRDTDCLDEIMRRMPMNCLPPSEQHIWEQNCTMNMLGVPVDTPAVTRINQVCDHYRAKEAKKVPLFTDGAVKTIGQTAKIIEWVEGVSQVTLPNLQAQTVIGTIEWLDSAILDPFEEEEKIDGYRKVRDLLLLRQRIGGAAVKKYKKLEGQTTGGRIHDNSRYHGAGTGRTTGGGFQYLNMPRAKVQYDKNKISYDEAVEQAITSFYDTTVLQGNPLEVAKALVRPMIKAPKGRVLLAADWSSIEYILLMWFCGEWDRVAAFKKGEDPYIRFATKLFNVAYDKVTGDQRQQAKPPVLGSGYMLGWRGLIEYAAGYGVTMDDEMAQFSTNTYRTEHPLVVSAWYKLKEAAHNAVKHHGFTFATHNTKFKVVKQGQYNWLIMTLPSGRSLFYCEPQLIEGTYGEVIKHRGINPKTKQWSWVFLKPMRIIENIIQGLGRDVLTAGLDNCEAHGFQPIMTIYDEIVCEEYDDVDVEKRFDLMVKLMCKPVKWAGAALPLKADGYISKRYKKG